MKFNQFNTFYLLLILFSAIYAKKIMLKSNALSQNQVTVTGVDLAEVTKQCLNTLMSAIPPDFCWKKGADFGIIPTGCPPGYFRSLALCYEYCGSGYTHVLGVCWASCPGGYADHGLTCFKHIFSWYFKHSYIPGSLTNFSDRVPCPEGMYRGGALCYRDCANIGLQNCGIGACATDGAVCAEKIRNMVQGVFEGIATALSTIATAGGAAAAKAGIKKGVKALGKAALNAVKNNLKKMFTGLTKKAIFNKAKEKLKEIAKEKLIEIAQNLVIETFCQGVWDESANKLTKATPDVTEDTLLASVDLFGIGSIVNDCKDTSVDNGALNCATSVVNSLSGFDPTGMLTIAGAFMHPVCDVTTKDYRKSLSEEDKINVDIISKVRVFNSTEYDQNCAHLWSKCNLEGEYYKVCNTGELGNFNDKAQSIYVGTAHYATFFEHMEFAGNFITFGPGSTIKCLKDYKKDEVDLTNLISTVFFDINKCYIINFRRDMRSYYSGHNIRLCDTQNPKLNLVIRDDSGIDNKNILIRSVGDKLKLTIYEKENYQGKSLVINGLTKFNDRASFGYNKIGSYKISPA